MLGMLFHGCLKASLLASAWEVTSSVPQWCASSSTLPLCHYSSRLNPLASHPIPTDNSTERMMLQATLAAAEAGRLKLLYITPECLATSWVADRLCNTHISLVCVDEAHVASAMSPSCRAGCLRLPTLVPSLAPDAARYAVICHGRHASVEHRTSCSK